MAARFNGPVYLVGSCQWSPFPRDVDIRIVISAHEFYGRYDIVIPLKPGKWYDNISQRWIDDMAKMNRVLATSHHFNSDIQVWPVDEWLDTQQHQILAAPSPRWHNPTDDQFNAFKGVFAS